MQLPSDVRPCGELDPVQHPSGRPSGVTPAGVELSSWLKLADYWANAVPDGDGCYCVRINGRRSYGLCIGIWDLGLSNELAHTMLLRVTTYHNQSDRSMHPFAWPLTLAGAASRVQFCKTQAERL